MRPVIAGTTRPGEMREGRPNGWNVPEPCRRPPPLSPPAAAGTNPKRRAVAQGTQQHDAPTGLVGLGTTLRCRTAGLGPRCPTECESTVLPGFLDDHSIFVRLLVPVTHSSEEEAWNSLLEAASFSAFLFSRYYKQYFIFF